MKLSRLPFIALAVLIAGPSARRFDVNHLEKYVDALPIPPRIAPDGPGRRVPQEITVTLGQFTTRLHRDLPPVSVWGYNGSSPGPTIEVDRGEALRVHWKSALPAKHLFPAPKGADVITPDVRSVTHLHGAAVSQPSITDKVHDNDGWPDAWIVPGEEQIAEYPNDQSARLLWYHDHAMGETGRNVAAGLFGLYEIHDETERALNLPSGAYEIPLAIQARQIDDDGGLAYTDDISAEYYGNAPAVNGKLWPFVAVEPRKYRFRVANVSNARSYTLTLADHQSGAAGPALDQIGSDGGFLDTTVTLDELTLAPAERADVIVDFSKFAGKELVLQNTDRNGREGEVTIPELMLFKVGSQVTQADKTVVPLHPSPIARISPAEATVTRQVVFDRMNMPGGAGMLTLNGKRWSDPIEERPALGSTEIWQLINTLTDIHPFHMHLIEFQVLDRTFIDVAQFLATGKIVPLGDPMPPDPNEMGWKDTVRVLPQMNTRIIMRFQPFPGFYVYHCHILEHEDMDMMRPFEVVK